MRFIYALAAGCLWVWWLQYAHDNSTLIITDDMFLLTLSIIMAGALAGGGDK